MKKKEANEIINKVNRIRKIYNICIGTAIFGAIIFLIIINQNVKVNVTFAKIFFGFYILLLLTSVFIRMCPNCGTHMGAYTKTIPDKCPSCKVKFKK